MTVISKHNRIKEYLMSPEEARAMMPSLRGACLSETMGPNWKDIYWTPTRDGRKDRCFVLKGERQ